MKWAVEGKATVRNNAMELIYKKEIVLKRWVRSPRPCENVQKERRELISKPWRITTFGM